MALKMTILRDHDWNTSTNHERNSTDEIMSKTSNSVERKAGMAKGLTGFTAILSNQETCKMRPET